ncbi:MAG: TAXI family TRAP transporter solute-binding subunit [Proteobacteria bacterium]|nr:TAXI family TRAP transporter solute-binding subunit [Pseudomonadota bacterium]
MKVSRGGIGFGCILLSLWLGLGSARAAQPAEGPVKLTIASFQIGSSWYVYSVTLGRILDGVLPKGSTIDTPPLGGGAANTRLVEAGKADVGFSHTVANRWAWDGTVAYDKPMRHLRGLVGGLDVYYLAVLASGRDVGPGLETYFQKQKPDARVDLNPAGSIATYAGRLELDLAGASPEELKKRGGNVSMVPSSVLRDDITSGRADAFVNVITVGHPLTTQITQVHEMTFLQPSGKLLQEMHDKYGFTPAVLPAGSFKGQTRDVTLPHTTTTLIARDDMPDWLAYAITKAVCEHTEELVAATKALKDFKPEDAWKPENLNLPLHPGAARYYRERGWMK